MPRINRSAEQWAATLDGYRAKDLDAAGVEALEWAWQYMFATLDGDYERLAAELHYEPVVLFKVFSGTYEASLDGVLSAIGQARKRLAHSVGFIETPITVRIFEALDYAQDFRAMVTITGETGRSKTTALQEWQRQNNHGKSVYVRCTSGATRGSLIRQIARAVGIGVSSAKVGDLEQRLFRVFGRKVLILDEAGHLLPCRGGRRGAEPLELVRDLHDICGCGVALCMTDVYLQALRTGPDTAFFEQFLGRVKYAVSVPRTIYREEVAAFCRAFIGGKPDQELLDVASRIARGEGKLRTLADDMAKARNFARTRGVALSAAHLVLARKWREAGGSFSDLHPVTAN
jgi:DNA transposition AAA+ family ATPase